MFDLQRFDGELVWTHYEGNTYVFAPDGEPDNATISISGIASKPTPSTSTTVTATLAGGKAISDVTVSGSDKKSLRITINGSEYRVDNSGKLYKPVVTAEVTNKLKRADGKVISATYSGINPNATNEQVSAFIGSLNSFTKNTPRRLVRVNKTVIG